MAGIYEEFQERGFIYQCTDEEAVKTLLEESPMTFYIGFDPTADSLHVGSLIPIMAMAHMQRAGHRPIAVTGGGTAMVGDPSGKTELRKMLTRDQIQANAVHIAAQLAQFLELDGTKGIAVDNAVWLEDLKYIDFLRHIGRHFSVNKMLAAESYKARLETGLSFLEFNYMLLQSYDFLVLFREYGCTLQMGGQDQWGNIVAGLDLVRREEGKSTYGLTFPLLMDASGQKLGKTVAGAIWLSPEKTPNFDFYQYWRNVDDADVGRFLKLFTFLPVDECQRLGELQPPLLNRAKEILAFEATRIVRGEKAAEQSYLAAIKHFPSADPGGKVATSSTILKLGGGVAQELPTVVIAAAAAAGGMGILDLMVASGLCTSKGEARRLVRQGGARVNDEVVRDEAALISAETLAAAPIVKAGKKRLVKVVVG